MAGLWKQPNGWWDRYPLTWIALNPCLPAFLPLYLLYCNWDCGVKIEEEKTVNRRLAGSLSKQELSDPGRPPTRQQNPSQPSPEAMYNFPADGKARDEAGAAAGEEEAWNCNSNSSSVSFSRYFSILPSIWHVSFLQRIRRKTSK